MRKILGAIALMIVGTAATLSFSTAASAVPAEPEGWKPTYQECVTDKGWFVNADEDGNEVPPSDKVDRRPEAKTTGFEFKDADLIHHKVEGVVKVDDMTTAGTFTVGATPDQPSFFSVEVGEAGSYAGYATLRWDATEGKWIMVTGGQSYKHASASELVKMTTPAKSSNVLTFGVGYTLNPKGTVTTVVSKVKFQGKDYSMACSEPVKPTASPTSASPTSSATTPSGVFYKTCSEAPHKLYKGIDAGYRLELDSDADGIACEDRPDKASLPVTGTKMPLVLGAAAVLLVGGVGLTLWGRRRKARFAA